MAKHPPSGVELTALLKVLKCDVQIQRAEERLNLVADRFIRDHPRFDQRDTLDWGITVNHAIEGVRCNGCEDATTLADVILGAGRIREKLARRRSEVIRQMDELERALAAVEDACGQFELCGACRGMKGRKVANEHRRGFVQARTRWEDCAACDGRGVRPLEVAR